MNSKRQFFIPVFILIVFGLLVWAFWPKPVASAVAVVAEGNFQESVEEEGRTVLRNPTVLLSPINGYLHHVAAEAGDSVSAGEVLIRIEPPPAPALDKRARRQAVEAIRVAEVQVSLAAAEKEAASAQLGQAEADLRRAERLRPDEVVSEAELDRARHSWEQARALENAAERAVELAEHQLRNAEAVLAVTGGELAEAGQALLEIRAPVNGVVLRRHRWNEGPVQIGERLLEIGNLSELEVQVDALSMDAVRIGEGMRVELARWGGDYELAGEVRRVEPAGFTEISALGVEEQRVFVWIAFAEPREAWEQLGEGYRVEARFIVWEGTEVLQIPSSALFREGGAWSVFVVEEGRARLRKVEVGRTSGLSTQINSGLAAGEKVIVDPGDRLRDGTRIAEEVREYRE